MIKKNVKDEFLRENYATQGEKLESVNFFRADAWKNEA